MLKKCFLIILFIVPLFSFSYEFKKSKIDSLASLINNSQDSIKVNFLNELAWEIISNEPLKANQLLDSAIVLAEQINYNKGIGRSLHYKGVSEYYSGKFPEAMDYFLRSYNIRKQIDDKAGLASASLILGLMFDRQNLTDKALNYYSQSLNLRKELNDSVGMASVYNNIGVVNNRINKFDTALFYFQNALFIAKKYNNERSIGLYYNNIGRIYYETEKYNLAHVYYDSSFVYKSKLGDYVHLATIYNDMANLHIVMQEFNEALNLFLKSMEIAKKANLNLELLDIYLGLSKVYEKQKDFEKGFYYQKLHKNLNDSILSSETTAKLAQFEMRIQYEKEKELEDLRQEKVNFEKQQKISRQRTIIAISSVGVFALVIILLILQRNYQRKRKQNQLLLAQNREIEDQRNEILSQRDYLEEQFEITKEQKEIVDKQRTLLLDSIHYAKNIQSSLLPNESLLENVFTQHFIMYRPKDIISGDFFWMHKKNYKLYIAVADCTGHGVPGALMSMLGIAFLNEIINYPSLSSPSDILEELRIKIKNTLVKTDSDNVMTDGIDMALVEFDLLENKLTYAGANNPMILLRDNEIKEFEPTENPIGKYINEVDFKEHKINFLKNDILYMYTDGFIDQNGGLENKKYFSTNFKNLLKEHHSKKLIDQKIILKEIFNDWKGKKPQVDDVTIIGIQV